MDLETQVIELLVRPQGERFSMVLCPRALAQALADLRRRLALPSRPQALHAAYPGSLTFTPRETRALQAACLACGQECPPELALPGSGLSQATGHEDESAAEVGVCVFVSRDQWTLGIWALCQVNRPWEVIGACSRRQDRMPVVTCSLQVTRVGRCSRRQDSMPVVKTQQRRAVLPQGAARHCQQCNAT